VKKLSQAEAVSMFAVLRGDPIPIHLGAKSSTHMVKRGLIEGRGGKWQATEEGKRAFERFTGQRWAD
jgi:hypothetical protein